MQNEYKESYLSDSELNDFISQVEEQELIKAPQYLETQILSKVRQQSQRTAYQKRISAKRRLLSYSLKVMTAAAAAIAFLIIVPAVEHESIPDSSSYVAQAKEETQKELDKIKENAKKHENETTLIQDVNHGANAFCNSIFEKTNQLFHKEEK